MPLKCQKYDMPKLLDVHLWGKCANVYATYKIAPIKDKMRIIVHRQWQIMTMTMMQDNDDETSAQLHIPSWPHGQINHKHGMLLCGDLHVFLGPRIQAALGLPLVL